MYSLQRGGRMVRLIDTPGFDDSTRDDLDILTEIAYWLSQAYKRIQLGSYTYTPLMLLDWEELPAGI
jgi:predicted GTPase